MWVCLVFVFLLFHGTAGSVPFVFLLFFGCGCFGLICCFFLGCLVFLFGLVGVLGVLLCRLVWGFCFKLCVLFGVVV